MEIDTPFWLGIDPGGRNAFGVARLRADGTVLDTNCVSSADEALALIRSEPLGVGIDAPLWWSSGLSSDRRADQWIRRTYKISGGTVQSANSLRGAALVQAAMFASRLRETFPRVPITEAHPKALAKALGGWDRATRLFGIATTISEHERDAILSAVAAREGFEGRWSRNLAIDRFPSEQNPQEYWLAPIYYFWPDPT